MRRVSVIRGMLLLWLVHKPIGISYIDGYGKYREEELSGWHAQVFQHEYDHLDGKTMADMCTQPAVRMGRRNTD